MKDAFKNEKQLMQKLDAYEVRVPEEKFTDKPSSWQRFIRYLASPAQDPLEKLTVTIKGLSLSRIIPLASGVFITIFQLLLLWNS